MQDVIDMTKEDLPCDQLSRKLLVKAIQVCVNSLVESDYNNFC